jgi:hypothetical protein
MTNDQELANPNDRGGEGATVEYGNDEDEQTVVVKPRNLDTNHHVVSCTTAIQDIVFIRALWDDCLACMRIQKRIKADLLVSR